MKKTNNASKMDDKLTDFTDRVLAGKSGQPDSNADEDVRCLEETILRLKRALPRPEMNEAALKQLESRVMVRLRQEQKSTAIPFWRKWFGRNWKYGQFRSLAAAVTISLVVLAALVVMNAIIFPVSSTAVSAAAFATARTAITVIALTGLILVLVWINRRK